MSEGTNGGRAEAYQALRESEELHRATLSNISDAVFITDDDGVFTFICPNVDVIFGYLPDEVRAMGRISRLLGEALYDPAELTARGEIRNIACEATSKSGEPRSLLIHLKAVSIQGGTVLYSCRDVTERKQAEEELRAARLDLAHASRLALVGELMASIAHEINQPLTAIVSNAGAGLILAAASGNEATIREILSDIRDQGRLASDVIERLRALSHKRPLELAPLDVNEVARDILRLVESDSHRRGVTLSAELAPRLPAVDADRVCLQQVLLNLVGNAMDAMDQVEARERQLVVRTRRLSDAVEVTVSDTGGGIPADRLPKLFDAFFTTKREGIGLGNGHRALDHRGASGTDLGRGPRRTRCHVPRGAAAALSRGLAFLVPPDGPRIHRERLEVDCGVEDVRESPAEETSHHGGERAIECGIPGMGAFRMEQDDDHGRQRRARAGIQAEPVADIQRQRGGHRQAPGRRNEQRQDHDADGGPHQIGLDPGPREIESIMAPRREHHHEGDEAPGIVDPVPEELGEQRAQQNA